MLVALLLLPISTLAIRRTPDDLDRMKDAFVQDMIEGSRETSRKLSGKRKLNEPAVMPNADDHVVTSLPYLNPSTFTTKHYAGHIPASNLDDKKLFYWLFEPDLSETKKEDGDIPLLIWLSKLKCTVHKLLYDFKDITGTSILIILFPNTINSLISIDGGPGCSSMDGLWLENGPLHLTSPSASGKSDWTIEANPFSWHKSPAYVVYIDQPVGTGLSFTRSKTYCKNDAEVNTDFHLFLENFLLVHTELFLNTDKNEHGQHTMKRRLYFSGESHAGHYIPSMMDHILKKNDDTNPSTQTRVLVDLAGAAIGNGWVDPYYQYAGAEAAYGVGMIDLAQKEALDKDEAKCQSNIAKKKYTSNICDGLLGKIVDGSHGNTARTRVSMYDNRIWEMKGQERSFPQGHKDVEKYLGGWTGSNYPTDMNVNYKDVLKAIHAEESVSAGQQYEECTDPPYYALSHQDGLGVTSEVVRILHHETKPRLLFFNGVNDMICNHVGNEKLLQNLEWEGQKQWVKADRYAWDAFPDKINVGPSGYMKEFANLLFLKVMASGHMVPMDVPDVSLEMMRAFMYSGSFDSSYQNLKAVIPTPGECNCDGAKCECPDCADTTCDCPTCGNSQLETPQTSMSQESRDDQGQNDQSETSTIKDKKEILVGLLMGIFFTMCFSRILERKRSSEVPSSLYKRDMEEIEALQRPNPYTDHPKEMEMVES